jgi:WD40 repeat protein
MKNKVFAILLLIIFTALELKAQTAAKDTGFTIRVINFDWMPNGKGLVVGAIKLDNSHKTPPKFKVFTFNLLTHQTDTLFDDAYAPAVSPDGKKIAFVKRLSNSTSTINIYDRKKNKYLTVTPDSLKAGGPTWSPDGKQLAFNVTHLKVIDIYTVNIATMTTKQITHSAPYASYTPVWSPVGDDIVYYFEKGNQHDQVYLTNASGGTYRNLTSDTTTHNFYPSWMGNDKIIYTLAPDKLAMMNKDGSARRVITGVKTFWARYNAATKKIGYLTFPPENKIILYDPATVAITEIMDADVLIKYF